MKLSILGVGRVGSTLAFAASMQDFIHELVLVGRNKDKTYGDALDMKHAQSFVEVPTQIIAGDIADSAGSDIIAVCASAPMLDSLQRRSELGYDNTVLMKEILPEIAEASPDSILVLFSNPVDVLTYFATEITGFPAERVIGSGTLIDSARLRRELSEELKIHSDDLRAYILGEHGLTQFAAMSVATAGGEAIELTKQRVQMIEGVMASGLEIFRSKGYTNFGVAMAGITIFEAIANDTKHTMPVSVYSDDFLGVKDICISLPAVVGRNGIERIMHPKLNETEIEQFLKSASAIREQIDFCRSALKC